MNSFVTKSKGTWGGADQDLAKQVGGKVMKSFFDFLEEEGTELDERVDSLMTRIKRAKALRKNRAKIKMGQKKTEEKSR